MIERSSLIEELKKIQQEYGWSDARLAKELGITPAMLSHIFTGKRHPGARTLAAIVRRFPELNQAMLEHLFNFGVEP